MRSFLWFLWSFLILLIDKICWFFRVLMIKFCLESLLIVLLICLLCFVVMLFIVCFSCFWSVCFLFLEVFEEISFIWRYLVFCWEWRSFLGLFICFFRIEFIVDWVFLSLVFSLDFWNCIILKFIRLIFSFLYLKRILLIVFEDINLVFFVIIVWILIYV